VLASSSARAGVEPGRLEAQLLTNDSISTESIQHLPVWFTLATPHSGAPLDLLLTCGTSAMVLGVCLVLTEILRGVLVWPLMPLIGAGSMTLTLYVGHMVALAVFESATDDWPRLGVIIAYWTACLLAGTIWGGFGWRGPLEWLLSRASTTLAGPRP
jgi:uncharacterized membrane protein YeiB